MISFSMLNSESLPVYITRLHDVTKNVRVQWWLLFSRDAEWPRSQNFLKSIFNNLRALNHLYNKAIPG